MTTTTSRVERSRAAAAPSLALVVAAVVDNEVHIHIIFINQTPTSFCSPSAEYSRIERILYYSILNTRVRLCWCEIKILAQHKRLTENGVEMGIRIICLARCDKGLLSDALNNAIIYDYCCSNIVRFGACKSQIYRIVYVIRIYCFGWLPLDCIQTSS